MTSRVRVKVSRVDFSGKRVLVTGGTGFIGGRLVEKLVRSNAEVCVLVRNYSNAARIGRMPVRMIHGDISNPEDVCKGVEGCDIVFHCAYGNSGTNRERQAVNIDGTRNLAEESLKAGVKRIVHFSTRGVYGVTSNAYLDESSSRDYSGDAYNDSKLEAERIILNYAITRDLPVVVLQPTIVYGPFAPVWTINVLKRLKQGPMILVDGGDGICNAVYIDDVVNAAVLAADKKEVIGETFLISAERPVTWRDFYRRFEMMLGTCQTVNMTQHEAIAYYEKSQQEKKKMTRGILAETARILREERDIRERLLQTYELSAARKIISRILPSRTKQYIKARLKREKESHPQRVIQQSNNTDSNERIKPLQPAMIQYYSAKTVVRIDKAKEVLGYKPLYDFESGMALTEQWAKWAQLLDV